MAIHEYKNSDSNYLLEEGNSEFLRNLKKVNIFVGANNSGKSRFLRQIFAADIDNFVLYNSVDYINENLTAIYNALYASYEDLHAMSSLKALTSLRSGDYAVRFNKFIKQIESTDHRSLGLSTKSGARVWDSDVALTIKNRMQRSNIYKELDLEENSFKHVYIPILRGVRQFIVDSSDHYRARTVQDYALKIEEGGNKEVFTGLSIYEEIKKLLLGSSRERKFIKEFEKFLSDEFFKGAKLTLIPDYSSVTLKVNFDDNDDREIFNVGDGIQSIIINTFPAFKYQAEKMVLYIEEPEMTMHPGIQRVLIEVLTTKFDNLQVFLTTHSNHFLDLTYDYPDEVAIFSFEKKTDNKFYVKDIGVNARILDLLGVRNSSVFLSNCVIWTEGVTDRMLIRKLLTLVKPFNYKEDYHFSLAEYGGSNLENFDFVDSIDSHGVSVQAISRTNYIVIDNDGITGNSASVKAKAKFIRRKKIKTQLGKEKVFDKHVEIENLIPYKVWKEVVKLLATDGKSIQIRDDGLSTEDQFNSQLRTKKIGTLLKKYLIKPKDGIRIPDYFKSNSVQCLGEDKKIIMQSVLEVIDMLKLKLNSFPRDTQALVTALVAFIKSSNK